MTDLAHLAPAQRFDELVIGDRWTIIASDELELPVGVPFEWRKRWLICDHKVGRAFDCVLIEKPMPTPLPVVAEESIAPSAEASPILLTSEERREQATAQGFTGDQCNDCGNFTMVRNGTCLKCNTCGGTTGCS